MAGPRHAEAWGAWLMARLGKRERQRKREIIAANMAAGVDWDAVNRERMFASGVAYGRSQRYFGVSHATARGLSRSALKGSGLNNKAQRPLDMGTPRVVGPTKLAPRTDKRVTAPKATLWAQEDFECPLTDADRRVLDGERFARLDVERRRGCNEVAERAVKRRQGK